MFQLLFLYMQVFLYVSLITSKTQELVDINSHQNKSEPINICVFISRVLLLGFRSVLSITPPSCPLLTLFLPLDFIFIFFLFFPSSRFVLFPAISSSFNSSSSYIISVAQYFFFSLFLFVHLFLLFCFIFVFSFLLLATPLAIFTSYSSHTAGDEAGGKEGR